MYLPHKMVKLLITIGFICITSSVNAAWTLNNQASRLSFISIKKDSVAEVHKFTHLSGSVDDAGKVEVMIQLASVDTAVPIRDERMREILFQTNVFPTANVTAKVDPALLSGLTVGQVHEGDVEFTLSLHGQEKTVKASVSVVKLEDGGLLVSSIQPIIISAADFQLSGGVEELRKIAGLPSISTAVPVNLALRFAAAN